MQLFPTKRRSSNPDKKTLDMSNRIKLRITVVVYFVAAMFIQAHFLMEIITHAQWHMIAIANGIAAGFVQQHEDKIVKWIDDYDKCD